MYDECTHIYVPQNLVFQISEFLLALSNVDNQLVLALLQFGSLLAHHDPQQLCLQALFLHRKVHDGRLGRDLWRVVGVAELGGDVELELWVEVHLFVSKFDDQTVA